MSTPVVALLETNCPDLKLIARGKVRDIYEVPGLPDALLFVATDRVSAFDVVMKNGIPNKGKLLTSLSLFFFSYLSSHPTTSHIPNHILSSTFSSMPPIITQYSTQLSGRSILVKKASVLPVEAIVRGYITGSAWKEYENRGTVHGLNVGRGLKESMKFETGEDGGLFTPSTKAEVGGKDENIHPDQLSSHLPSTPPNLSNLLKSYALSLYSTASSYTLTRGLILADTKFEFGLLPPSPSSPSDEPTLILIDECLTPDSSRFWPMKDYKEDSKMIGFDKQFLREWLLSSEGGFREKGEAVEIPEEVVRKTWETYKEAYRLLTGGEFVE